MKQFVALIVALDGSTGTLHKKRALEAYFAAAFPADAAWAVHFLAGGRLARIATSGELRGWIAEVSDLPSWLVEDCYAAVGDLAETLALLYPQVQAPAQAQAQAQGVMPGLAELVADLLSWRGAELELRKAAVLRLWRQSDTATRWVSNKLLTGALRVGVSDALLRQAMSAVSGVPMAQLARRMMGEWRATEAHYRAVTSLAEVAAAQDQPYPFFLASALEPSVAHPQASLDAGLASSMEQALGPVQAWQVEWKWDGIRVQVLRRAGACWLYSRGEQRLDGRFPELEQAAMLLPEGTVLDAELIGWQDDAPLPFSQLQPRIQRRKPSAKQMLACPVVLLAYDLLELDARDMRGEPMSRRRQALQSLLHASKHQRLRLSPVLPCASWEQASAWREQARVRQVEGLMLKRLVSSYQDGRKRGDWWKWKLAPMTIDAVLIYSQAGHGRRAGLHTDHTFALWHEGRLLPIAKAYSGLSDAEMKRLDQWIRAHTLQRFGPVRSVAPEQVFELAFEAVHASARHKSGVAVRFPRILRWRHDKAAADANQLHELQALARGARAETAGESHVTVGESPVTAGESTTTARAEAELEQLSAGLSDTIAKLDVAPP